MIGRCSHAHRALVFAGAAGGALENGLFAQVDAEQSLGRNLLRSRSGNSRNPRAIFFGIEDLARVVGRTVLLAAPAFDAGVRLQGRELRHVLAGVEAEVLVAFERRNAAEAAARQEHRRRTQHQVQVLGVRNQRQKDQQRQRVRPPQATCRQRPLRMEEVLQQDR